MNTPKMTPEPEVVIEEELQASEIEIEQEEDEEELEEEEEEFVPTGDGFKNRVPCNWTIQELEDGIVQASNSTSGETFTGSIEDFNLKLRG